MGPEEIANMVWSIAQGIPDSFSLNRIRHAFFEGPYDSNGPSTRLPWVFQCVGEAWEFGRLAAWSKGVIYVGPAGFLRALDDHRAHEFGFLKRRGHGVVCYFTGSDIRSIPVMNLREQRTGIPNIATYLPSLSPVFSSVRYDEDRKAIAAAADKFADVVFTAAADQEGYLTSATEAFRYFFPDDAVTESFEKFEDDGVLTVVHAPSSPIIKGTPLVRAAVAALRAEGLSFEYVELSGVKHTEVAAHLAQAHIVLNEFYASMPGVFGVEAMAAGAVLLTSAAEEDEPDLPEGSNAAWVVTPHFAVTEKLREALTADRDVLLQQAKAGRDWVLEHATASRSATVIGDLLATIPLRSDVKALSDASIL